MMEFGGDDCFGVMLMSEICIWVLCDVCFGEVYLV